MVGRIRLDFESRRAANWGCIVLPSGPSLTFFNFFYYMNHLGLTTVESGWDLPVYGSPSVGLIDVGITPPSSVNESCVDFDLYCRELEFNSVKFNLHNTKRMFVDMLIMIDELNTDKTQLVSKLITVYFNWRQNTIVSQCGRRSAHKYTDAELDSVALDFKNFFDKHAELLNDVLDDQITILIHPDSKCSDNQILFVINFFMVLFDHDPFCQIFERLEKVQNSLPTFKPQFFYFIRSFYIDYTFPTLRSLNALISLTRQFPLSETMTKMFFTQNKTRLNAIFEIVNQKKCDKEFLLYDDFLRNCAFIYEQFKEDPIFNVCVLMNRLYYAVKDFETTDLNFASFWVNLSRRDYGGPLGFLYIFAVGEEVLPLHEVKRLMREYPKAEWSQVAISVLYSPQIYKEENLPEKLFRLLKLLFIEVNEDENLLNIPPFLRHYLEVVMQNTQVTDVQKFQFLEILNFVIPGLENICSSYLLAHFKKELECSSIDDYDTFPDRIKGVLSPKIEWIDQIISDQDARLKLKSELSLCWADVLVNHVCVTRDTFYQRYQRATHSHYWAWNPNPTLDIKVTDEVTKIVSVTREPIKINSWYRLKCYLLEGIVQHYNSADDGLKPQLLAKYRPLIGLRIFYRGAEPLLSMEIERLVIV